MADIDRKAQTDATSLNNEAAMANASRTAFSQQAFEMPGATLTSAPGAHELRNLGIAAGSGFVLGGALTGAGEVAAMKLVEPIAKPLGALAFGFLGGGRAAAAIWNAPALTIGECLTPKPLLIGGLIGAGLLAGGYELYKHAWK